MRRYRLAGVALGALLLASGCSGLTAGSGGSGDSGAAAPGVTDDTIKLGMITPLSGPAGSLGADSSAGAQALIADVNAHGGVNGRKLQLVTQDDQYQPSQHVAAVNYMATREPVLAVWGNVGAAPSLAGLPAYQQNGIPLLFPLAPDSHLVYDKGFALTSTWVDQYKVLSNAFAKQPQYKGKVFGFLYQDDGTSKEVISGFQQGGTPVRAQQPFPRGATTYLPQLEALRQAGVTDVIMVSAAANLAVALKEANQLGYKATWYGTYAAVTPELVKLAGPLAEGVITVNPYAPPSAGTPGTKAFIDAMNTYQPSGTKSGIALNSWLGGKIIVDALQRAGRNLTRDSLLAALNDTKNLDMGGAMPPVTLTAADHVAGKCVQLATVHNGDFRQSSDFFCQGAS